MECPSWTGQGWWSEIFPWHLWLGGSTAALQQETQAPHFPLTVESDSPAMTACPSTWFLGVSHCPSAHRLCTSICESYASCVSQASQSHFSTHLYIRVKFSNSEGSRVFPPLLKPLSVQHGDNRSKASPPICKLSSSDRSYEFWSDLWVRELEQEVIWRGPPRGK